jgi:hypothetical protein
MRLIIKKLMKGSYVAILLLLLSIFLFSHYDKTTISADAATEANLKVAFVGDDGAEQNNTDVLNLIKKEKAAFVVDGGDLDYKNNPTLWDKHVSGIMGAGYPYFVAMGNHDQAQWPGYSKKIADRMAKLKGETCTGSVGVQQACSYRGIFMLLLAPGMAGSDHPKFIQKQLAASKAKWKICSWHYNIASSTTSLGKAGADVYEACRKGGAIIANAHAHYYMRTKTLVDMRKRIVDPNCKLPSLVCVALGKTFIFISGLGGKSVGTQPDCPPKYPYGCKNEWAKIYASEQKATYGALFIVFNYKGNVNRAHGYYKNVDGKVVDEFDINLEDSDAKPTGKITPTQALPIARPTTSESGESETFAPEDHPTVGPVFTCLGACLTPSPSVSETKHHPKKTIPVEQQLPNPDKHHSDPTDNDGLLQMLMHLIQQFMGQLG